MELKLPIAPLVGSTGGVVGRSDVGLGQACQFAQQRRALWAFPGVAAIDQDVAIVCQCRANGIQRLTVLADVLGTQ